MRLIVSLFVRMVIILDFIRSAVMLLNLSFLFIYCILPQCNLVA